MTYKYRSIEKSAGWSFLRAEGFSCSLCVLYGGLGITNCNFLSKKYPISFSCKIFQFSVIKTLDSELDPDPQLDKMLDPDPKSMRIHNPVETYSSFFSFGRYLSTTSTMGSVRATFLMADMLNPYTSSHQLILSSCNNHFKVLCWVYLDGGHVEPVHVLPPVDLVVLLEQAFQSIVSSLCQASRPAAWHDRVRFLPGAHPPLWRRLLNRVKRLDQGHLHPKLEVPGPGRQSNPGLHGGRPAL